MNQKVEFLEKQPWRKAGANVTDYFNYGFDEESWNDYCRKQAERRRMKRKLNAKIRAQRRHAEEEEASCAYSSPGRPSILAFRESEPIANLVGGQPESSSQDGRQRLNDGGSDTQMCHYEDSSKAYQLPPPLSNNSLFEVIKRRAPPCPRPPSSTVTLVSGNSKGLNSPSASLRPYSSRRITISPGVTDTAEARESYRSQEKRDKDRDSSRAHGRDKEKKRSRCREKEGCSSSYDREAQMKHREPRNQGYKCRSDRGSGEKRRSDKDDGSRKRSESSSVRSSSRKNKENSKTFSAN